MIDIGKFNEGFAEAISVKLKNKFSDFGIDCKSYIVTGLELNDDDMKQNIADYQTRMVMKINHSSGKVSTSASYLSGSMIVSSTETNIYEISIIDLENDKTVWKAILNIVDYTPGLGAFGAISKYFSNEIILAMKKDGLIEETLTK